MAPHEFNSSISVEALGASNGSNGMKATNGFHKAAKPLNGFNGFHEDHATDIPDIEHSSQRASRAILETSLFINQNNPTIIGAWGLQQPSDIESADVRHRFKVLDNESLGPNGDHRVRATGKNIEPPGQYKAICKLFMTYADSKVDVFMGTGWLIRDDVIATAGHCLYDWKFNGGLLKDIKCYFGYDGPRSPGTYRYGLFAAAPAEYIKASSRVHDVGFIRLNQPVSDVPPFKFSDTPEVGEAILGVVGYPGDINFGENLYEHWQPVDIDLVKTGTLLSYKIDSAGGQSGSPVLRKLPDGHVDSIGVHIAGGFPNMGSVIGPIGNVFEEYLLALDIRGGYKSSSSATILTPNDVGNISGFQTISLKPTIFGRKIHPESKASESRTETSKGTPVNDANHLLDELFGETTRTKTTSDRHGETANGTLLQFPEALRVHNPETDAPLPKADPDRAVEEAKNRDDIQTVFFVNFAEPLKGDALKEQRETMKLVKSWQTWSSVQAETKVQQMIDAKKLSDDSKGAPERGAYRAKVFDYLFRKSTWFAKTFDNALSKHIEVKVVEFHAKILLSVLEGFSIPSSVFDQLDKIIKEIANGISASSKATTEKKQYWIMLTKYIYEPISQTIQTVIRTISFVADQEASRYASSKGKYESVAMTLNFSQYQADFNEDIYAKIGAKVNEKLVEQGAALLEKGIGDVDISI